MPCVSWIINGPPKTEPPCQLRVNKWTKMANTQNNASHVTATTAVDLNDKSTTCNESTACDSSTACDKSTVCNGSTVCDGSTACHFSC